MPPTGPRTRRPEHQGSRTGGAGGGGSSSRPTADRNDVFESIFGRPAGGHHSQAHSTAQTNPSHPPPSQLSYPSYSDQAPRSLQTGYEAFAPPLPPTVDPIAGPSNYGRYQQDGYARSQQATYQSSQNVHGGYGQAAHPPTNNGLLDAYVPTSPRRTSLTPSSTSSIPSAAYPYGHSPLPNLPQKDSEPRRSPNLQYNPERPRNFSDQSSSSVRTAIPGQMNEVEDMYNDGYPRRGNMGDGNGTIGSTSNTIRGPPPVAYKSQALDYNSAYGGEVLPDLGPAKIASSRSVRRYDNSSATQSYTTTPPPLLPDIVSDVRGLNIFDNGPGSYTSSDGTQPSWPATNTATSTAQSTPLRKIQAGLPVSPPTPRSVTSEGATAKSYEDELRDHVHPVPHPDQYVRNHRRQQSDGSIVSISTVQSGLGSSRPGRGQSMDPDSRYDDYSPAVSSPGSYANGDGSIGRLAGRPSVDSVRSMPQTGVRRGNSISDIRTIADHRAMSFSGSTSAKEMAVTTTLSRGQSRHGMPPSSYHSGEGSPSGSFSGSIHRKKGSVSRPGRQTPLIYPAFLSKVADVFQQMIPLGDRPKDGLVYKEAFDGREAVDLVMDIIRTQDRNLALIIGRSLDSQKFFHDVTYMHKLRDSAGEVYRFRERLPSPFSQADQDSPGLPSSDSTSELRQRPSLKATQSKGYSSGSVSAFTSITSQQTHSSPPSASPSTATTPATSVHTLPLVGTRGEFDDASEESLPQGIFTLLTNCYSPTCTRDSLCYSVNCPRRPEQQRRLNLKVQPVLTRKLSEESLGEVKETGTLWIETVSEEVRNSVSVTEQRRQEAINELMYTERDFVRDMEYLRDSWVRPLRTRDIIPQAKREEFVVQVFWNVHDILGVNGPLANELTKRQKHSPIVPAVGDILLQHVPRFNPFVSYGSHQLFGKYEFEKEKGNNPVFAKFVDDTERDPSSRKLELNGYLTKPTTRLARYPLLLEAIMKSTPDDSPDKKDLPEVIRLVKEYLTRVNLESGRSENLFNLAQLDQQLVFRPGENIDLHLRDKSRELVYKGPLKHRGGAQGENADLQVFLFDHALLMVKPKLVNKHEQYKVYRKPIPLELLVITSPDETHNNKQLGSIKGKTLVRNPPTKAGKEVIPKPESKHGYSVTLIHLGRKGYNMTLWAPTYAGRKNWLENIEERQQILRDRSRIFDSTPITEGHFNSLNKLNCAAPYDQGRRMIYGTDEGVYFSNLRDDRLRAPTKVLAMTDVTQVDVLEEFQLLIVLAERSVTAFPLEALDPTDPQAALKRGKRLSSHTSFFKTGVCLGRTLLCIVKSSPLSSTIKTLEALDQSVRGKKQPTPFRKFLNTTNEPFKVFKEFYIPTESSGLSFLKTKLCVATTRGFEVVDLETLDTQGLLDPSDSSLDFVSKRENVHPIAIYRIEENFLLCYAEFAFYVNKTGWRAKPRWAIQWEGYPTAFALHYPYVIAFEQSFVEIRHVETGNLVQIIIGNNIRCLFADMPPSTVHAPVTHIQPSAQGGPPMQFHPQFGFQPVHQSLPQQRGPMRNQIVFASEEGNVYFLQVSTAKPPTHQAAHKPSLKRR